jgi:hypothetical protein
MARVYRRDPATVPCDENVLPEIPKTQEALNRRPSPAKRSQKERPRTIFVKCGSRIRKQGISVPPLLFYTGYLYGADYNAGIIRAGDDLER